jgi:hypothetical protein
MKEDRRRNSRKKEETNIERKLKKWKRRNEE